MCCCSLIRRYEVGIEVFFLLSFLTFATASYTQRELSFKFLSFIDFNSEWDSFRFSQTLPRLIAPLSCIRFCLSDYGRFWKKLKLETLRGSSTFVTAFVYGRQFERIRLVIHRFVSGTFSSWILPPFFDIFFLLADDWIRLFTSPLLH